MADPFLLVVLLLLLPASGILGTRRDPAAPASIPAPLTERETSHFKPEPTHARVDQDDTKVGLFIAAAAGTCTLMAVVYCIYNKFYNKQPYLHTQLQEDPDPMGSPSMYFQGSSEADVRRADYGSLSDTPSVISVPPYLSPPPSAMQFPRFLAASSSSRPSSRSLKTISAQDLQRSCI